MLKYIDAIIATCILLALSLNVVYYATEIQPLQQRVDALQAQMLQGWRTDLYMTADGSIGGISKVVGNYHIKLDAAGMSVYNISKYNRNDEISVLCMRISTSDAKDISDAIFAVYGGK